MVGQNLKLNYKIYFIEIFQYVLGIFPSSFLIRAWDRQCRSYKQIAIGGMSDNLAKNRLKLYLQTKQNKKTANYI